MFRLSTILILLAGSGAHAASPIAEVICDEREALMRKLEISFGAKRQSRGTRGPDAVIEIWTVPSTGEWTLVQSYANGRACIVAMGENWETLHLPPEPA